MIMALADDLSRLRRLVNEPTTATYSDAELTAALERHLALDSQGRRPYQYGGVTLDPLYVTTYDVYAAAADVWEEKAAVVADEFDYSGDGANMTRSQKHAHFMRQAQTCRAKAQIKIPRLVREGFQNVGEEIELAERTGLGNA
jgi:hypothetical protein